MILRRDDTVQTTLGNAVAGARVYYLTQPANLVALAPLAAVYSDTAGTPAANPLTTDGFGHVAAYLDNGQLYTVVYVFPGGVHVVYPDQNLGNSPSTSLTAFGLVPTGAIDGTNTTFTLPFAPTLLILTLNGVLQTPGLSYMQMLNTITFASAPTVGDTLFAMGLH